VFTVQKKAVRARSFIRYLEKLKRHQRGRRLVLFFDGLPAHRAKVVCRWIEANKRWLTAHRFPAYAPEYNPAEYVWSATKTKDHAHRCPPNLDALERRIRRGLKRVSEATILKGCLKASKLY
jgi:transposase